MKKIIIVEDDPGIQDSARLIFRLPDYQVTIFPDGRPILAGSYDAPDIFLIDKQLPGVDGLDLCRHLKKDQSTSKIPVVIMSASPQANREATNAGAEGFIEKPYTIQQMRELISNCIKA